jgi:lipopolysaccharide export system permease protein
LLDGTIYGVGGENNSFQKTEFTVYDVSLALTTFGEMRPRAKDPKEMTLGELWGHIAEQRANHQLVNEEEIELHRKFSIPFACVVFTLVGIPLSIPPTRAVRSRGFSMSLGLIFLYYIPMTVGQTLAQKGFVPVLFGLWLPNIAFLGLGAFLFRSAARETPLRFFDRLEVLLMRARSIFMEGLRMLGAS